VWHSYCDWYLELSKTIFYSDNKKKIKETKEVAVYIFEKILILLHPFIPFITEKIWLRNSMDKLGKNYLMLANWPTEKIKKDKENIDVENLIHFISSIRSFKNELGVSPGSFVDISTAKIDKKNRFFLENNDTVLKKLGRISNFLVKDKNKSSASLVIKGNIFKIYFDENIDLNLIKLNLLNKQKKYQSEIDKISNRLSNKDFIKRAPKHIVEKEKTTYNLLKSDIKKITHTVKSL